MTLYQLVATYSERWFFSIGFYRIIWGLSNYFGMLPAENQLIVQVVPGRAGGGSFKREKNYIAKKGFAYRMCARQPTSAMPKPSFWCERAFCRSMVVMSCALRWCVMMSWGRLRDWDEVMWLVVRWHISWAKFTKYCACHEKWLRWWILVSHETSITMRRATRLPPASPNIAPGSRKWVWWLIIISNETSSPMRGATGLIRQVHQILHLPSAKKNSTSWLIRVTYAMCSTMREAAGVILQLHLQLHQIYCTCHETWPSWLIVVSRETSSTMSGASGVILQLHQIQRLPRNFKFKISAENPWIASAKIKTIRRQSDHDPTIRRQNRHLAPAASETLLVPSCRRILYGKIQHFALRLSPKISRNAAPATKSDTPTSPNTAPATKSDSHD